MSVLSREYFHNEAAAFEHVESILWPHGPACPHCGNMGRIYKLDGVFSKPSKKNPEGVERHGLKKCAECRKQFTVRIGTIFEESHIPLHKWLQAIHLMCSSKKGISSNQLHRVLEITLKSAWFLSHRIREAMREGNLGPIGGNGKTVEVDETYFGKKSGPAPTMTTRGKPFTKGGKTGPSHKRAILGLVERGGAVRTFHVERANKENVAQLVTHNVHHESVVYTDESVLYRDMSNTFADHQATKHSAGEYVRYEGGAVIHSNTIENYFSVFKRGMKGIYQHCSEKHLHRYLAEFDFRYNNRVGLGVDDKERAIHALNGIVGKRLTYRSAYSA
ncbi:IS1595 family transposase [Pararhizobium sp. BT-229]|uniref:IS1595 family transposase n=1 Tax=Pararhizobium sp. BT-229 TaxID=2986923 RepID=UPI0021F7443D|nr:IS1595 family transposase [Pararhizobium sp. BT-229]MCV9962588.1 IS1595 family transposase [Pararhizobium sp. BT-229]